jgi:hypothetical protein
MQLESSNAHSLNSISLDLDCGNTINQSTAHPTVNSTMTPICTVMEHIIVENNP